MGEGWRSTRMGGCDLPRWVSLGLGWPEKGTQRSSRCCSDGRRSDELVRWGLGSARTKRRRGSGLGCLFGWRTRGASARCSGGCLFGLAIRPPNPTAQIFLSDVARHVPENRAGTDALSYFRDCPCRHQQAHIYNLVNPSTLSSSAGRWLAPGCFNFLATHVIGVS